MKPNEGNPELTSAELGSDSIQEPPEPTVSVQRIDETPQSIPRDPNLEPGFHRLDRRFISAEIIAGSIFAGIVSILGLLAIAITFFVVERWIWFIILGSIGFVLMWLWAMALYWPRVDHRYTSWRLVELGLDIRKGVFWQHRISVPRARVQHVDVSQGPLQRNFGLAELTIYTAGTQNSSVKINGLAHPVATEVRNELISKQGSEHVV